MRNRLSTKAEFLAALQEIPAAARHPFALQGLAEEGDPLLPYALWKALLYPTQEAIDANRWNDVRTMLNLYDAVISAGERSEMFESSYVAFLEDTRLPRERAKLREFWLYAPKIFAKEIKHDRGLR